ncbi:MAG TPA: TauD/TfdA family dioxygenase [Ilumatobacteraceae bacterium]
MPNATPATSLQVRPRSRAVAAEVTGIDLAAAIDDDTMLDLRRAFARHSVLVFPDQHLDPVAQVAFAQRWGTPLVVTRLAAHAVPGTPAVLRVTNTGKASTLTETWHLDSAFFETPPPITILAAQEIPELGGDTMWANQYLAYDALSPTMQRLLAPLRAAFTGSLPDDSGTKHEVVTYHPVVRTHPATGRRSLAIGQIHSVPHFEGMSAEESRGLLEFLYQHASRPEFVYRHRWQAGDVVMWDNRCLLHYAIHDYEDDARLMHRVTVIEPYDERHADDEEADEATGDVTGEHREDAPA